MARTVSDGPPLVARLSRAARQHPEWGTAAGAQAPSNTQLAAEYRLAGLTMRHVLAQLEDEGLVSGEQGRGTFVRARLGPGVLVVAADPISRLLLLEQMHSLGYRVLDASGLADGGPGSCG